MQRSDYLHNPSTGYSQEMFDNGLIQLYVILRLLKLENYIDSLHLNKNIYESVPESYRHDRLTGKYKRDTKIICFGSSSQNLCYLISLFIFSRS